MNRGSAGYSLLEVLVAFAIMSMVLAALLPAQSRLLQRSRSADEGLLAQELALSRLAEVGVAIPDPAGVREVPYRRWILREVTVREGLGDGEPDMIRLRVDVLGPDGRLLASEEAVRLAE
ncbi:type IV pilus modification PilV family protein [Defluviimonas salinarum]|uniref:Prepilin-type N-terminal cleavage/methylation domain-containing protein n=1 Tax=Defluviimonas salinarum TaxID=2992147 RepID=A0ABT3J795_9RHOB|nr:prepilin-type N-terminal cleavage/methylation domain-containing protein [Defluviimonas salinarum]MCW3783538.1 prepilin-type N-terminal cleavage/methylation domain-containing protein [Defluviimonas salinarum]